MKNHIRIGNRIIQTNKRFDQLKRRQKEFIDGLLREKTIEVLNKKGILTKQDKEDVLWETMSKIDERGIWIPFQEVKKFYSGRIARYRRISEKQERGKKDAEKRQH